MMVCITSQPHSSTISAVDLSVISATLLLDFNCIGHDNLSDSNHFPMATKFLTILEQDNIFSNGRWNLSQVDQPALHNPPLFQLRF